MKYKDKHTNQIHLKYNDKYTNQLEELDYTNRKKRRERERSMDSFSNKISRFVDIDLWYSITSNERERIWGTWEWINGRRLNCELKQYIISSIKNANIDKSLFRQIKLNKILNDKV